jgi:hypothetical protein
MTVSFEKPSRALGKAQRNLSVRAVAAIFVLSLSLPALAVVRTWPGTAPCAGTLQACVDASAASDTVQIVTNTPITENVFLSRSITLEGGEGFSAQMADGRSIEGFSADDNPYNVTVQRIALSNAQVFLRHSRAGAANIEIRHVSITSTSASTAAGIRVSASGSGIATVRISENRLRVATVSSFASALQVKFSSSGNGSALIDFNYIENVGERSGWGILADASLTATAPTPTLTVSLVNNEVRGRFTQAAIGVTEGQLSSSAGSITARVVGNAIVGRRRQGVGIVHIVNNGSITTKTVNNTVVDLISGIEFDRWVSASAGTITGTVLNNLISRNDVGLAINTPFQAGITENHNLLFDNFSNIYTPGFGDVTSDPMLRSSTDVRLRSGSPAINASNSLATLDVYGAARLGLVDADGLRRFKEVQSDIGAYEFGDISLLAKAVAPIAGLFVINDPQINGNAGARLFTTTSAGALFPFITNTNATGVRYSSTSGNNWRIFNQITTEPMPVGAQFNVFVPKDGGGTFVHTANAANTSGHVTRIDNEAINNFDNRIVLATSNWNPGSATAVFNPHTISVGYFPPSWFVLNNDVVNMPVGAAFNIYSQDPSPNAYLHTASIANRFGVAPASALDHPLLNATPCAQVYVTPISGGQGDTTFDVYFNATNQRWTIFNHNGVVMPPGAQFNIVIDAGQVAACNGVLFADDFEN